MKNLNIQTTGYLIFLLQFLSSFQLLFDLLGLIDGGGGQGLDGSKGLGDQHICLGDLLGGRDDLSDLLGGEDDLRGGGDDLGDLRGGGDELGDLLGDGDGFGNLLDVGDELGDLLIFLLNALIPQPHFKTNYHQGL